MNAIRTAFSNIPEPGSVQAVTEGVLWLRMPLPFSLDHINLYLIDDGDGWIAIDCGIGGGATRDVWRRVVAQELGGKPLKALLVTHFHPDHLGAAGWLCGEYGLGLWITEPEYRTAADRMIGSAATDSDATRAFYRTLGMSPEQIDSVHEMMGLMGAAYDPLPTVERVLAGEDRLTLGGREWQVRVATGHSPAHAVLYSPDLELMISGDQVLPRISSNVGLYPDRPDEDPLGHWLESLERLNEWPDDTLVLPSHNEPFYGLHRRLQELQDDHAGKLEQLLEFCAGPATVMELVPRLYPRELGKMDLMLAAGECLAHLEYLVRRDRLMRETDEQGLWRFCRLE
ncbi:MBL fold metallo-hydrolase [Marinobacterium aestuariivivens]|uniref:MBL fold metallo-hydrolase n=1 Tax=Marinobacterium aestuariivivens TaxID=1698799 RepID=A0ABW2A453_9GAMM